MKFPTKFSGHTVLQQCFNSAITRCGGEYMEVNGTVGEPLTFGEINFAIEIKFAKSVKFTGSKI